MQDAPAVVVWDIDGTLIPADLRWLRRAIASAYDLDENDIMFPDRKVHGYTDESIAIDTAVNSGVQPNEAESGIGAFRNRILEALRSGQAELERDQAPYAGAAETINALYQAGTVQTVLTGNLRAAAEFKLRTANLDRHLDFEIGAFGSDARDRMALPMIVAERFTARYGHSLDPARTVLIGDAPNDVLCAQSAGFRVIAVTHRSSREELESYGPDAIVDRLDPREIDSLVNSLTTTTQAAKGKPASPHLRD